MNNGLMGVCVSDAASAVLAHIFHFVDKERGSSTCSCVLKGFQFRHWYVARAEYQLVSSPSKKYRCVDVSNFFSAFVVAAFATALCSANNSCTIHMIRVKMATQHGAGVCKVIVIYLLLVCLSPKGKNEKRAQLFSLFCSAHPMAA